MNKYKLLGVALMLSIILTILGYFELNMLSIAFAVSNKWNFIAFLGLLCVTLFGSFAALALDKLTK